jgi:hypothetical protein
VKYLRHRVLLPASLIAGSFLCLLLLVLFTDPLNNVAYAVVFFVALIFFLASLGLTLALIQNGEVSRKSRDRILAISIFLVVLLMFRSVGSLSWVGGLILLLIAGGWLFYISRRA